MPNQRWPAVARWAVLLIVALLSLLTASPARAESVGDSLRQGPDSGLPVSRAGVSKYSLATTELANGRRAVLRWNPCQVITYKVNVAAVPRDQQSAVAAEIRRAVARLSAATSLVYRYRGMTSMVPRTTTVDSQPAELVIAVTSPTRTDFTIGAGMLGYGGYRFLEWTVATPGGPVTGVAIARGWVVVDAAGLMVLRPGFGAGASRGNVFLHELAHTVGLEHINARDQLMYPTLFGGAPDGFSDGDRAGLAAAGREQGCLAVPSGVVRDLS